nr:unnamed protein product [Callosobruchus chinensis]
MVDSELLINEVQKRPVLWDTTSELYKDKNKKKTLLGQKYAPFYWKILKQKQTQNIEIWVSRFTFLLILNFLFCI